MPSVRCLSVSDVGVLWPNSWMDQDANWYGGRPQYRPRCVRWGASPPPRKGHSPQFSSPMYCGQTVAHLSYCWALVLFCHVLSLKSNVSVHRLQTCFYFCHVLSLCFSASLLHVNVAQLCTARYRYSVRLSVRLSITCWYCVKTTKPIRGVARNLFWGV